MLKKLSHMALASALGLATLAFHIGDASAQAPRPRSDRNFEFGQGRAVPGEVERSGQRTERFRYYHLGWWYETPWWQGGSQTAPLRVPDDSLNR